VVLEKPAYKHRWLSGLSGYVSYTHVCIICILLRLELVTIFLTPKTDGSNSFFWMGFRTSPKPPTSVVDQFPQKNAMESGQIIATSAKVNPNGVFVRPLV